MKKQGIPSHQNGHRQCDPEPIKIIGSVKNPTLYEKIQQAEEAVTRIIQSKPILGI